MKIRILLISILGLILIGCDDDNTIASSIPTLTEGTFNLTGVIMYETADCSGTPITGQCTSDEEATTEATCPSGMCADGESTTEAACPANMWYSGICMDGESTTEATCPSGGWMTFGWITTEDFFVLMSQDEVESITLTGGVITYSDGIPGTYNIDGTTISITNPAGCWDYEDEVAVDAATEAACDAEGGEWEEADTISATLNTDGTISAENPQPAECYDDEDEEIEVADKAACESGPDIGVWTWDSASVNVIALQSNGELCPLISAERNCVVV